MEGCQLLRILHSFIQKHLLKPSYVPEAVQIPADTVITRHIPRSQEAYRPAEVRQVQS